MMSRREPEADPRVRRHCLPRVGAAARAQDGRDGLDGCARRRLSELGRARRRRANGHGRSRDGAGGERRGRWWAATGTGSRGSHCRVAGRVSRSRRRSAVGLPRPLLGSSRSYVPGLGRAFASPRRRSRERPVAADSLQAPAQPSSATRPAFSRRPTASEFRAQFRRGRGRARASARFTIRPTAFSGTWWNAVAHSRGRTGRAQRIGPSSAQAARRGRAPLTVFP